MGPNARVSVKVQSPRSICVCKIVQVLELSGYFVFECYNVAATFHDGPNGIVPYPFCFGDLFPVTAQADVSVATAK